ncbi:secretion activator protein [Ruegeria lacuscaerulensis ITI-1157]|nr:secretion activator protein [Ruegeria lacuscaerulensis ITI-1157]SHK06238.1 Predicted Peptidoglycan domain-containing protein [Ruegeria lacuscaerulensis ITI-1157]
MRSNYPQIQDWIGLSEGGYVNHPEDPGGATDRGITQRTYDAWNDRLGRPRRTVRGISKAEAEKIIEFQYLDAVRADVLPSGLDYAMGDYAVNSGPAKAAMDLQRVLGVRVDGVIGLQTLAAVQAANTQDVIVKLCQRRMSFLKSLRTWRVFGKGWTRRVMGDLPGVQTGDIGVIDRAVRMARESGQPIPAPKQSAPGKAEPGTERLFALILQFIQRLFQSLTSKGQTV